MTQGSRSEKNAQSESQCYKRPLIVLKIKYSTTFKLVGLCVVSCVGREIPQRDPTGLFTILYPSDQKIGEFHLPQRCRTKHFEATKLWKDWSWWCWQKNSRRRADWYRARFSWFHFPLSASFVPPTEHFTFPEPQLSSIFWVIEKRRSTDVRVFESVKYWIEGGIASVSGSTRLFWLMYVGRMYLVAYYPSFSPRISIQIPSHSSPLISWPIVSQFKIPKFHVLPNYYESQKCRSTNVCSL